MCKLCDDDMQYGHMGGRMSEILKPEAESALSAEEIEQIGYGPWTIDVHGNRILTIRDVEWNAVRRMALSSLTARNEWKEVVIEELIVSHTYRNEHEANPRKALKDAIHWSVQIALDPAVSEDAQKLRTESIEAIARHFESQPHAEWWTPNIVDEIRSLKGK